MLFSLVNVIVSNAKKKSVAAYCGDKGFLYQQQSHSYITGFPLTFYHLIMHTHTHTPTHTHYSILFKVDYTWAKIRSWASRLVIELEEESKKILFCTFLYFSFLTTSVMKTCANNVTPLPNIKHGTIYLVMPFLYHHRHCQLLFLFCTVLRCADKDDVLRVING